jgi:hypothetical protein
MVATGGSQEELAENYNQREAMFQRVQVTISKLVLKGRASGEFQRCIESG